MIHKFYYKFRVTFIFAISTFFVLSLHFPSQYFISSAHAALPAIALAFADNLALAAGRVLLLNGTRLTGASLASNAANAPIYATAAANGQIYGTVAANASEFIVPSIASVSNVAASGGINGYLASAALSLPLLLGGSVQYITSDGDRVDVSGSEGAVSSRYPLTYGDSPRDFNYEKERKNQGKAENNDPSVTKPSEKYSYTYYEDLQQRYNGVVYDSYAEACEGALSRMSGQSYNNTCGNDRYKYVHYQNLRVIGSRCYFEVVFPSTCDPDSTPSVQQSFFSVFRTQKGVDKGCAKGTSLSGSKGGGCQPDYKTDGGWYGDKPAPTFENKPGIKQDNPSGLTPHPSLIPAIDPNTGEVPLGNSDNPDTTTKAKVNPDGSLAILESMNGLLAEMNIKLNRANDIALENQKLAIDNRDLLQVIERRFKGTQLKHEEDGTKEPVTIVNNTYYDVAGNEYNVTYIVRDNPGANPKPITPGDKLILPDGTEVSPNYDPTDYPDGDITTTTKTQPVPDPNPTPNPNPNPNPAPSPVQDVVTKTKIDPRTGDIVEETTKTTPLPDGSKKIEITVQIQPDPKSNPDPTPATEPTPEPTKFTWECGIDGKPPCQVTQDVGKLADSDWSDVDVPPANYTEQLKDKLFGKLFDNFKFTPPTSSVCPTVTVGFTSISCASNIRIFSQPFVLDYHCKNLFEPLYEQFRALFQLGWFLMALYIVLSA